MTNRSPGSQSKSQVQHLQAAPSKPRRPSGTWFGAVLLVCLLALLPARPAWGVIRDGGIDPANLGKGDWIVTMTDATNRLGGHINSVTNENSLMLFYKSLGVRYIVIKAATSNYLFKGCYTFPQFNSNVVNIAHTHGIKVFGYNRSYGGDIPGEIAISDHVFPPSLDQISVITCCLLRQSA